MKKLIAVFLVVVMTVLSSQGMYQLVGSPSPLAGLTVSADEWDPPKPPPPPPSSDNVTPLEQLTGEQGS